MVSNRGVMRTLVRGSAPPLARPTCLSSTIGSRMSDSESVLEIT